MTKYIPIQPTVQQAAFLLLSHVEALYGGQAGGGKSEALLAAALQYVDVPGYNAILLRRNYGDLKLPEALMDRAAQWLQGTDARWVANKVQWVFPSGATLTFGYLDTERSQARYQSAAFQYIGLDELTQFTETQYRFMFSRLRRKLGVTVPLRMRTATNPGGVGHEWVKMRFVNPGKVGRPFVRAALMDNPHLDQEAYQRSLARLPPLERSWYEYGDWDAAPGGSLAERQWFPIVDVVPPNVSQRVRFWDLAATEAKQGSDPDYTVGTRMCKADDVYYVEHVVRGRWGPGSVEKVMYQTASADGTDVTIAIEQEGGAGGKLYTAGIVRALAGWHVRSIPASGDKVVRAMPFIGQAESGYVRLVRGAWNSDWLDEITRVPQSRHDDQWDSAAGAFALLAAKGVLFR